MSSLTVDVPINLMIDVDVITLNIKINRHIPNSVLERKLQDTFKCPRVTRRPLFRQRRNWKRDAHIVLDDGECIAHWINNESGVWVGTFKRVHGALHNVIIRNGIVYTTISGFATAHIRSVYNVGQERLTSTANGWRECRCGSRDNWDLIINRYDERINS